MAAQASEQLMPTPAPAMGQEGAAFSPLGTMRPNVHRMANLMSLRSSLRNFVAEEQPADGQVILGKLEKLLPEEDEEEIAALRLQSVSRGHIGRNRFRHVRMYYKTNKAIELQKVYRGHMARKVVWKNQRSAQAIQRVWAGHQGRSLYLLRREQACATRLQCAWRQRIARFLFQNSERHFSALVLQRMVRCWIDYSKGLETAENVAVLRLQRVTRGHLARVDLRWQLRKLQEAKMGLDLRSCLRIQRVYRGHVGRKWLSRRKPAMMLALRIRSAVRVQRVFRGYLGRVQHRCIVQLNMFERYSACVLPIQSLARGYICRKKIQQRKSADLEQAAARMAALIMLRRQDRAAAVIQATWKAYLEWKAEMHRHRSAGKIQLWFRVRHMHLMGVKFRQSLHTAATRVEKVIKGHLGRKLYKVLFHRSAVVRIQKVWRGHRGRMAFIDFKAFMIRRRERMRIRQMRKQQQKQLELQVAAAAGPASLEVVTMSNSIQSISSPGSSTYHASVASPMVQMSMDPLPVPDAATSSRGTGQSNAAPGSVGQTSPSKSSQQLLPAYMLSSRSRLNSSSGRASAPPTVHSAGPSTPLSMGPPASVMGNSSASLQLADLNVPANGSSTGIRQSGSEEHQAADRPGTADLVFESNQLLDPFSDVHKPPHSPSTGSGKQIAPGYLASPSFSASSNAAMMGENLQIRSATKGGKQRRRRQEMLASLNKSLPAGMPDDRPGFAAKVAEALGVLSDDAVRLNLQISKRDRMGQSYKKGAADAAASPAHVRKRKKHLSGMSPAGASSTSLPKLGKGAVDAGNVLF